MERRMRDGKSIGRGEKRNRSEEKKEQKKRRRI
jgi:hypothetical protein